jgi:polar amino acid transport system substrate-binding protein
MRTTPIFIIALLLAHSFIPALSAQDLNIITEEYPPLNFIQNGKLSGSTVAVVREILRRLDQDAEIKILPWARGYNLLKTQPNVVLFTTTRTEEREDLFHWVGPVAISTNAFYAKKGSDIQLNSIDDAKQVNSIATYKDDAREQMLQSWGFDNLDSSNSAESNLRKLLSDRVDLWLYDTLGLPGVAQKIGVDVSALELVHAIDDVSLYIAVSKGTPEWVVQRWQETLDCMKQDGTFKRISRKWLPDACIPEIDPTQSNMVCESTTLQIYTENSPPGNYIREEEVTGFAVAVVREIQTRTGYKGDIQVVPWARGYNATLTNPNVALFSTTRLPQREKLFKWVGPLYRQTWGFYAKKGANIHIDSLEDAKALARIGTYHKDAKEQFLTKQGFTNLVSTNTNLSNIKRLIQGSIDLWVSSDFNMPYLARQAGVSPDQMELAYAIRVVDNYIAFSIQTSDAIVQTWQRALDGIKQDGTYSKFYNSHIVIKENPSDP